MDEKFKKHYAYGMLAIAIYGSIPLCKNRIFEKHDHLSHGGGPLAIYFLESDIAGVSGTTAIETRLVQLVQYDHVDKNKRFDTPPKIKNRGL